MFMLAMPSPVEEVEQVADPQARVALPLATVKETVTPPAGARVGERAVTIVLATGGIECAGTEKSFYYRSVRVVDHGERAVGCGGGDVRWKGESWASEDRFA